MRRTNVFSLGLRRRARVRFASAKCSAASYLAFAAISPALNQCVMSESRLTRAA